MQVAKNGHSLIPPPWEVSVLLLVYLCLQIVLLHTYSTKAKWSYNQYTYITQDHFVLIINVAMSLYDIAYSIIATLLLLGIL